MNFCQECGHELDQSLKFCTNCGEPIPSESDSIQVTSEVPPPIRTEETTETRPKSRQKQAKKAPKKEKSKKSKLLILFAIIALAAVVGTHFFLKSYFDPNKTIAAMNDAYYKKDKQALLDLFDVPEGTVADKDSFQDTIIDYGWKDLRKELEREARKASDGRRTTAITDAYGIDDFILVESKPILFGLYQQISFSIIPVEASVTLPLQDMTLILNGETYTSTKEEEEVALGSFVPGTYEWSFTANEKGLLPLENTGEIDIYSDEKHKTKLDIDWGFTNVYLDSDVPDATLYINDKSYKKKINEIDTLYPVMLNEDIKVHAVTKDDKGKEIKSEKIALNQTDLYIPFEHIAKAEEEEEMESAIRDAYEDFREDYESAIMYVDFSYIESYFKNGSKIEDDYEKFVNGHNDIGYFYYDFMTNDIISIKALDDGQFKVITEETFEFGSDSDDDLYYEREKEYIFFVEDDNIYIDKITNLDTKKTKI